jgi:hypothetical protein
MNSPSKTSLSNSAILLGAGCFSPTLQVSTVILTFFDTMLQQFRSYQCFQHFAGSRLWHARCAYTNGLEIQYVQDFNRRYPISTQASGGRQAQRTMGRGASHDLEKCAPRLRWTWTGDRFEQPYRHQPRGGRRNFRSDETGRKVLLRRHSESTRSEATCPECRCKRRLHSKKIR